MNSTQNPSSSYFTNNGLFSRVINKVINKYSAKENQDTKPIANETLRKKQLADYFYDKLLNELCVNADGTFNREIFEKISSKRDIVLGVNSFAFYENAAKRPSSNQNVSNKFLIEYGYDKLLADLSVNENNLLNSQSIEQITRECDLFVAALKLTNCIVFGLSNSETWIDEDGPFFLFRALAKDPLMLMHEIIADHVIFDDAIDAYALEKKCADFIKNINNNLLTDNMAAFQEETMEIGVEAKELLCQLYYFPSSFTDEQLHSHLSLLCSLDASNLVRTICKKIPSQFNLNNLLPIAVRNLHLNTVKVLVELGADVNQAMLLFCDSDTNIKIYGPPLLYPFLPLTFGSHGYCFLGIGQNSLMPYFFRPDHPKLINMMTYLFECGTSPESKIILKPLQISHNETPLAEMDNQDIYKATKSIKEYMLYLLDDDAIKEFTPELSEFIKKIAGWTPEIKFQHHSTTTDEINAFIKYIEAQSKEINEIPAYKEWKIKHLNQAGLEPNNNITHKLTR